ncbi:MAG: redoxin domain-containing protein [Pseudomonadota bacterium]
MNVPTVAPRERFPAAAPIPALSFPLVGGGDASIGGARDRWTLLVVYRGRHCPKCKTYLDKLEAMQAEWEAAGFDILTVSADPADRAEADVQEFGWTFPVAHSMAERDMRALGLYVSDPLSPEETDRRFAEPGIFCIRPDGRAQIVAISNGPAARPDLADLLAGMKFTIETGREPRGQV